MRVVLCGSMSSLGTMRRLASELGACAVVTVVPDEDRSWDDLDDAARIIRKHDASLRHLRHIADRRTAAILVVNVDRYGEHDYIGPNTFAEIAVAFAEGRRIFIYQDLPERYVDELRAWGAVPLSGDLRPVAAAFSDRGDDRQLELFDPLALTAS